MPDSLLETFIRYGTQAERLAFTPDPPTVSGSAVKVVYVWYETDNPDDFYLYANGGWKGPYQAGGGAAITALTGDVTATGPGSVAATIANSAVTLAKIANAGANSKLLGSGDTGSGAPYSEITLGTNLTMSGTTLNASGGSGGLVLLESHTASASASLNFTTCLTSTYDEYVFDFVRVIPATDNVLFNMRVSYNAGATWQSAGSSYFWVASIWYANLTQAYYNDGTGGFSSTAVTLARNVDTTIGTNTSGVFGTLRFFLPSSAINHRFIANIAAITDGGLDSQVSTWGRNTGTTAVNAIQFYFDGTNIASGDIRCYGIAK